MENKDDKNEEPNVNARFLSLNMRLSSLEYRHCDLGYRVDELEEDHKEMLDQIDTLKKQGEQ